MSPDDSPAWLFKLCLPEGTTAARLRALLNDERARLSMSPDPMVAEVSAIRCGAWKMDAAAALGWGDPSSAYTETPKRMADYLAAALRAFETEVRR